MPSGTRGWAGMNIPQDTCVQMPPVGTERLYEHSREGNPIRKGLYTVLPPLHSTNVSSSPLSVNDHWFPVCFLQVPAPLYPNLGVFVI